LNELKKHNYHSLLEAQTDAKISLTEKKHLQAKLSELEADAAGYRQRIAILESKVRDLDSALQVFTLFFCSFYQRLIVHYGG
jgi:hypothetical protein